MKRRNLILAIALLSLSAGAAYSYRILRGTEADSTPAQSDSESKAADKASALPKAAQPAAPEVVFSEKDQAEMVRVAAGNFIMGRPDSYADERPQREVFVEEFLIYRHEVSVEQYQRFLNSSQGTARPPASPDGDPMPSDYFTAAQYRHHPVVNVSWNDAQAYCQWAGGRLPSEEEWEKAARGTDGRIFPWGNAFDESRCNWDGPPDEDKTPFLSPVDSFPYGASPYGALNMAGNAWEWVDAFYGPYPENYNNDPIYSRGYRVIRGGSWLRYPMGVSATARDFSDPRHRYNSIGFRCVQE